MEAVQAAARALIAETGTIKAMFILQDFHGFALGVDEGRLEFFAEHGDAIVRMAIVGDERWKTESFMFIGRGARKTRIEFFPPADIVPAHSWLAELCGPAAYASNLLHFIGKIGLSIKSDRPPGRRQVASTTMKKLLPKT